MMKHNRKKFTLLELLIVVSVILILISLLFPALQNARKKVLGTQCKSNLKQLYVAHFGYEGDFGFIGYDPTRGTTVDKLFVWGEQLRNYLNIRSSVQQKRNVYYCPGVPPGRRSGGASEGCYPLISGQFSTNPYAAEPWNETHRAKSARIAKVPRPSHYVFHLEARTYDGGYGIGYGARATGGELAMPWHEGYSAQTLLPPGRRFNSVCYDGHVEELSYSPAIAARISSDYTKWGCFTTNNWK